MDVDFLKGKMFSSTLAATVMKHGLLKIKRIPTFFTKTDSTVCVCVCVLTALFLPFVVVLDCTSHKVGGNNRSTSRCCLTSLVCLS